MLEFLEGLPPALVLGLAFLIPALEASTLLGVIFPGEVVILVAGAAAHAGGLPLWAVIVAAVVGAVAGDTVGFALGRRFGDALVDRLPRRLVRPDAVARTRALIRRRGGMAVFVGRFTALFRALVPGLAGASGVEWRVFLPFNIAGGTIWATGVAVIGYLAGAGLASAERQLGLASEIVAATVVVVLGVVVLVRRRSRPRPAR